MNIAFIIFNSFVSNTRSRAGVEMAGWKEDLCLCFYVSISGFSSFSGDPVRIALTLDIASISSISESNMVIVAQWQSTIGPLLAFNHDFLSNYSETEWQMPELCLIKGDSRKCLYNRFSRYQEGNRHKSQEERE